MIWLAEPPVCKLQENSTFDSCYFSGRLPFGIPISDLASLEESVSLYISRAAEKLRRQHSHAGSVYIIIRTNPFNEKARYYANSLTIPLPTPTDDTVRLTPKLHHAME